MAFSIRLTTHAIADLKAAKEWYNQQKDDLGVLFIETIDKAFNQLKREAVVYRKIHGEVRKVTIKEYPFAIYFVYNFEKHSVDIIAVLHTKRDELSILMKRIE